MTTVIGGSAPSITFSDSTTQSTAFTGLNQSASPYTTSLGYQALNSNTGTNNTAVGYQAGYTNSTGTGNVYLGQQAGYTATGNNNVMVGYYCGYGLTSGIANTFLGQGSGYLVTTGSKNSILGGYSGNQGGLDIRTSSNYIVLSDGDGNVGGYWSSASGWQLNALPTIAYNASANATLGTFGCGNAASVNTSAVYQYQWIVQGGANAQYWTCNYLTRGGSFTYGAYCNGTSWVNSSDVSKKENVSPIKYGLAEVLKSNPVNFDWKANHQNDIGFIAQEMELIIPEIVSGEDGNKGISYSNLVAVAFKAIQDLNALVTAQATEIQALKAKVGT
jgi:hypothetical protein